MGNSNLEITNHFASWEVPSVLCFVRNVHPGNRVSPKGESKLPSLHQSSFLSGGEKKRKTEQIHLIWRQALVYESFGFMWSAGWQPVSHLDTGNTRTFSALNFSLPHRTQAWNSASKVGQAKTSNSFLCHLIISGYIYFITLLCNPLQTGW